MIVYITMKGEYGEGGSIVAVHKTRHAAVLDVEINQRARGLQRIKDTPDMSVVARWTDGTAGHYCDYIEIERWKVRD